MLMRGEVPTSIMHCWTKAGRHNQCSSMIWHYQTEHQLVGAISLS